MRARLATCLAALALLGSAPSATAFPVDIKGGVDVRFLDSGLCRAWRHGAKRSAADDLQLNWVLGFLSGRATARGRNYLAKVSNEQVWAMVIDKCAAMPGSPLGTAAYGIERDLLKRRR